MGLFTLHKCCSSCSQDTLKSYFKSKNRLPIPEFSDYHCAQLANTLFNNLKRFSKIKRKSLELVSSLRGTVVNQNSILKMEGYLKLRLQFLFSHVNSSLFSRHKPFKQNILINCSVENLFLNNSFFRLKYPQAVCSCSCVNMIWGKFAEETTAIRYKYIFINQAFRALRAHLLFKL